MSAEYQLLMGLADENFPNPVANALFASGYSISDVADALGISRLEVKRKLNKESAWNSRDRRVIAQMIHVKPSTIIEWLSE